MYIEPRTPIADIGEAKHIGGRRVQQDAFSYRTRMTYNQAYMVGAIADGVGSAPGSEHVARAAVEAVCALGQAGDYEFNPSELLPMAAAVIPLHAEYAAPESDAAGALSEFGYAYDAYSPNTTIAVVTIGENAEIKAGWLGDCRVWVRRVDGELFAITEDHNMGWCGRPHVITRSLGKPGEGAQRSAWMHSGKPEWRPTHVLLTTDGVHDVLPERVIAHALATAPNARRAALWLTRWAVRAAGPEADNATALVFAIAPAESTPTPTIAEQAAELAPF